jgi:mannose-6-phosphate isomerase-like protein (cupin superfamily)
MTGDWEPDDSIIEEGRGAERIKKALEKFDIDTKDRVTTSRDDRMDLVRNELRRPKSPPGISSWQLPVIKGDLDIFLTVVQPGAVVPLHSHKRDLFRVVLSGSIYTEGKELKSGDWMFVPAGTRYSYSAPFNPGAILMHVYE